MPNAETNTITESIRRLQGKLIDLSGFNRLINFKHSKGRSLQLTNGALQNVYDRLVNKGKSINIDALPEPDKTDYVIKNTKSQRPDEKAWAAMHDINTGYELPLNSDERDGYKLTALQYEHKLATVLRKIEREARLGIEETGSNMLYLIVGFLEYPDRPDGDRLYQAPILSIPISITREKRNNKITYQIAYTGEDITENLSLQKKLLDDFDIDFPDLPEDPIDLSIFFNHIRRATEGKKDFVIRPCASIGLLSYSSMLLYKDLDPEKWVKKKEGNWLYENEVITGLFGENGEANSDLNPDLFSEANVESEAGDNIPLIFDADSSQHAAIMEVIRNKRNLVIEGPPGTGKSQTIANLLAACMKSGLKVLFVSEKLAALQVVRKRLENAGLGKFTLELHSNKTSRKEVLDDLNRRMNERGFNSNPFFDEQELKKKRAELKQYSNLLQQKKHNRRDLTVQDLIWRKEYCRQQLIDISEKVEHLVLADAESLSSADLTRRKGLIKDLCAFFSIILTVGEENAFYGLDLSGFELYQKKSLFEIAEELSDAAKKLGASVSVLENEYGVQFYQAGRQHFSRQFDEVYSIYISLPYGLPYGIMANLCENGWLKPNVRPLFAQFKKQLSEINTSKEEVAKYFKFNQAFRSIPYHEFNKVLRHFEFLNLQQLPVARILHSRGEFVTLCGQLYSKIDELNKSLNAVSVRSVRNCADLLHLNDFIDHVLEAKTQIFRNQSPKLTLRGSVDDIKQIIKDYKSIKRQWDNLGTVFYLDTLPESREIKKAISVLREGDRWYRIFQSDWRQAISCHKRFSRAKKSVRPVERLKDLILVLDVHEGVNRFNRGQLLREHFPKENNAFENNNFDQISQLIIWNEQYKHLNKGLLYKDAGQLGINQIRDLKDKLSPVQEQVRAVLALKKQINDVFENEVLPDHSDISDFFISVGQADDWLKKQSAWIASFVKPGTTPEQVKIGLSLNETINQIIAQIQSDTDYPALFGEEFKAENTNLNPIEELIKTINQILVSGINETFRAHILSNDIKDRVRHLKNKLSDIHEDYNRVDQLFISLNQLCETNRQAFTAPGSNPAVNEHDSIIQKCGLILENKNQIEPNHSYALIKKQAVGLGLSEIIRFVESGLISADQSEAIVEYAYANCILSKVFKSSSEADSLMRFYGSTLNSIRDEFRALDNQLKNIRRMQVYDASIFNARPPYGNSSTKIDEKTELALINHLLPQRRPRVTVRRLISRASLALQELKPCFMMGPQAVAQYLTPGIVEFDIVIMDEASQLKPEYAVGSIARGKQLVVVGDSKQLPPTNFFNRMIDEEEEEETIVESESILDLCRSQFKAVKKLLWHYRSQHQSLIAFSNSKFYDNELLVFPSPREQSETLGLSAVYLKDAVYQNQVNRDEAIAVVNLLMEHILKKSDESIGVVTLNIKQKELISELFETRKLDYIDDNDVWEHWNSQSEPVFIKNLENVQGDERDYIIVSTTFGKAPGTSVVRQNFGPISKPDGWRRLNVLFTRARKSVTVVTSLQPSDILEDKAVHDGSKVLKQYLSYIQTGVLEQGENTFLEPDSEFERAVIKVLERKGFEVTPQLGVAGYRIDIAVKAPNSKNTYIAAIECDGASFHSAKSARDRDRIRQEVLESLGWKDRIWRIWSTDWFRNPEAETEKLVSFLNSLKAEEYSFEGRKSWITISNNGEITHAEDAENPVAKMAREEREEIDETISQLDDKEVVEIGDTIIYQDESKPGIDLEITITMETTNEEKRKVSRKTPLAITLLGAAAEEEVTMQLNNGTFKVFLVKEIRKGEKR